MTHLLGWLGGAGATTGERAALSKGMQTINTKSFTCNTDQSQIVFNGNFEIGASLLDVAAS
jgi:hypothetical protein